MHMKYFTVDDTIQFNNLEDTASDIQEELLDESADQENDEDDVIDEFSLKEIDDDGVNDSSQAEIEEHLQNAAKINTTKMAGCITTFTEAWV